MTVKLPIYKNIPIMNQLQEANNKEFLKELQKRVKTNQLPEKEITKILSKAEAEA
jgi:hypothetical protein